MSYPDIAQPRSTLPTAGALDRALSPSKRDVLRAAPPVPPGFHGAVTFRFRSGKLTYVEMLETFEPEEPRR